MHCHALEDEKDRAKRSHIDQKRVIAVIESDSLIYLLQDEQD